jgi:hypothetical protein
MSMAMMELVGRAVGQALAPLVASGASIRRSRLFHPHGVVYRAEVVPIATSAPGRALAERLAGPAMVRLSTAWWKGGTEWLDVLGLAVRFRGSRAASVEPEPGDQDLLFATIRWWWTTLLAPLTTDPHSFLWDDYHAVSPFFVEGLGRVKLRLASPHLRTRGETRAEGLDRAVALGLARFVLEARRLPFGRFTPIVELRLTDAVEVDQQALRFSPFLTGRGVEPRGLVNAMRRATYGASQRARPSRASGASTR